MNTHEREGKQVHLSSMKKEIITSSCSTPPSGQVFFCEIEIPANRNDQNNNNDCSSVPLRLRHARVAMLRSVLAAAIAVSCVNSQVQNAGVPVAGSSDKSLLSVAASVDVSDIADLTDVAALIAEDANATKEVPLRFGYLVPVIRTLDSFSQVCCYVWGRNQKHRIVTPLELPLNACE
jgi:hypothetical protein